MCIIEYKQSAALRYFNGKNASYSNQTQVLVFKNKGRFGNGERGHNLKHSPALDSPVSLYTIIVEYMRYPARLSCTPDGQKPFSQTDMTEINTLYMTKCVPPCYHQASAQVLSSRRKQESRKKASLETNN